MSRNEEELKRLQQELQDAYRANKPEEDIISLHSRINWLKEVVRREKEKEYLYDKIRLW